MHRSKTLPPCSLMFEKENLPCNRHLFLVIFSPFSVVVFRAICSLLLNIIPLFHFLTALFGPSLQNHGSDIPSAIANLSLEF